MCGFIGILNENGITGADISDTAAMSNVIRHRGPDLNRGWDCGRVCFGFRRLSIIDLEGGAQPYVTPDGRYACVYNGEVYNYLELRDELIARGEVFDTVSEIEVMVRLYSIYGESFISRLRGMFAFLIYDRDRDTVMAGRDPFGIKPLYYRASGGRTVFASELKAFMCDSGYEGFGVDKTMLQHYFSFQFVPEPNTVTGNISILPKGSYMICSGGKNEIFSYWKPVFSETSGTYDSRRAALREAIEESVRYHMISDVPVGSFLSSGVDSAIITAVASKLQPGIKAFTVGFDVKGFSEIEDAQAISAHLDIEHIVLRATLDDFKECFEKTIYHLDSPVADPSVVAIFLISREASRHVKVILSGEGSDELFGGYRQYATAAPSAKMNALPGFIKKFLLMVASVMPDGMKGKGFITRGCVPLEKRFVGGSFIFTEKQKKAFLRTFDPSVDFTDLTGPIFAEATGYSPLRKMQHCDLNCWLPSDILVKGDRLSMAHSLEARVPFLDREVFKAARALADNDKIAHGTTKYILRDAFSDLLNHDTVIRPKKGYPVPVRVWLKDELFDWARDILRSNTAQEFIDEKPIIGLLEKHAAGKGDWYRQIWAVLAFITWYRLYVTDRDETKRRVAAGEL